MAVGEIVVFKIRKDGSEELARIEAQDRGYWTDKHGNKVRAWMLNNWTPGQPGFNHLKSRITKTPLSISKVVTIVTQDYPTIHEKAQSNEINPYPKKSCTR